MPATQSKKIAIIGAGFTGVALAAAIERYAGQPVAITLFEKTEDFAAGDAYRTPFPFHLLNARVKDMSALEDDPDHFLNWLTTQIGIEDLLDPEMPLPRQFVPRILYRRYLQDLLASLKHVQQVQAEVTDLQQLDGQVELTYLGKQEVFDKAILAFGNNPPSNFPFPISDDIQQILNPWDYTALTNIPADDPVLIVGTGLSMVDAVLTLHNQNHKAKIYAVSRRGLLPLPHTESGHETEFDCETLPNEILPMMQAVRAGCHNQIDDGGDWRAVIHTMRIGLQDLWVEMDTKSRKRFLRHVLPYWNIHRHRIHVKLYALLEELKDKGQLEVLAGRIQSIENGEATLKLRKTHEVRKFQTMHVINCMGSGCDMAIKEQSLLASMHAKGLISLDPLKLGLATSRQFALVDANGLASQNSFTIGPPMRGELWECIAVPEIRVHCKELAKQLVEEKSQKIHTIRE